MGCGRSYKHFAPLELGQCAFVAAGGARGKLEINEKHCNAKYSQGIVSNIYLDRIVFLYLLVPNIPRLLDLLASNCSERHRYFGDSNSDQTITQGPYTERNRLDIQHL